MNHEMSVNGSAARTVTIGAAREAAVLGTLILVGVVASLNLSMANVALPTIGRAFNAPQTALDLVAVGYMLGLAASALWLGPRGYPYERKVMLQAGTALAVLASLAAAFAPTVQVLILARLVGGLAGGLAFPTTLALVAALWSGGTRTRYIKLWSGVCGAAAVLGPMASRLLLQHFAWGSVFLVAVPLALAALALTDRLVPNHVDEAADAGDDVGGRLSVVLVATLALLAYADLMALVCHVYVIG
jgi:MFS family permease